MTGAPRGPGYLDDDELASLGLLACGRDVRISRLASLHGAGSISVGDHARIDDFTVITAGAHVTIGRYVHLAARSFVAGGAGVDFADFSGFAPGVSLFTTSDDYSGGSLTNPTVPAGLRAVSSGRVRIGRHVIVGAHSVILPAVTIGEGCAVGALSLVDADLAPWGIYAGVPARRIKERRRDLLDYEARLGET